MAMNVDCVTDPGRASALLKPLRLRILEEAREPRSATEIAVRVGLRRQKVNYHVRALADAGFVRRAGTRLKRNMTEQRWVATAQAWVLAPQLLGPLGADRHTFDDAFSAAALLSLLARAQRDVTEVSRRAADAGQRLATLSLQADFRFQSPDERQAFTEDLHRAIADVVARHTHPVEVDGEPGRGRPFRLVLGCHPVPPTPEKET